GPEGKRPVHAVWPPPRGRGGCELQPAEGRLQLPALDLKANGPFTLFGRRHEAVVGASFNRQKGDFNY
ncbi:hypothetical protein CTI14_72380, partial [Methylobacterium radiotolerans]